MENLIDVRLITQTEADPLDLSSHAAKTCYSSIPPAWGSRMNVENDLFKTGHHTTLEHSYFTFAIEGIAISNVKMGIHLVHPFYNTDERSGRFCSKMFLKPDLSRLEGYIKNYWPEVGVKQIAEIMEYLQIGLNVYRDNIDHATEIAKKFIPEERPFISEQNLEKNSPKIAMEQLRVFLPMLLPTGMDHTVDLITLVSLYYSAWDPVMRDVTAKMAAIIVEKYPEISFMFNPEKRSKNDWAPKLLREETEILYHPKLELLAIDGAGEFILPKNEDKHPIDLMQFKPEYMNNSFNGLRTEIECSMANMGDDQRHRTIKRSEPVMTGNFYFYPIVKELKLEKEAVRYFDLWKKIAKKIPPTLATAILPYGAMAKYRKNIPFNALAHEMQKRLCWTAHSEIYYLGKTLREKITQAEGADSPILKIMEPNCYASGICGEGGRYCGRDIKLRISGDFFPERRI
jgi:thymidylate synthase ThyX